MVQLADIIITIIAFHYYFFQIALKYFISNFTLLEILQYFPTKKLKLQLLKNFIILIQNFFD